MVIASLASHPWLHRFLGFAAFGVDAGEIMSSAQIAVIAGLPYTALRDAILAHPTLLEGLGDPSPATTLFLRKTAPSIPTSSASWPSEWAPRPSR